MHVGHNPSLTAGVVCFYPQTCRGHHAPSCQPPYRGGRCRFGRQGVGSVLTKPRGGLSMARSAAVWPPAASSPRSH